MKKLHTWSLAVHDYDTNEKSIEQNMKMCHRLLLQCQITYK